MGHSGATVRAIAVLALAGALVASAGSGAAVAAADAGGTTAILCGRLIDGVSAEPIADAAIVVAGDRIVAVGDRSIVPAGARVVDLGRATVLPGLIDVHSHPLIDEEDNYQIAHLEASSARKALKGLKAVQRHLLAGWTTLRIPGDADVHFAHLEVRRAIDEGLFVGPRITGAGHYLSVTGGGGDINFIAPEQRIIADGVVVDGVGEVRKAIRREIKYGSDWIKLLVTGAFMSAGDDPQDVHFSPEELAAAVEEAGRHGVPVMAHAHAAEGIRQAVAAGVRSIEHGTFVDEEGIRLMVERGTFLVPTIYIGDYYLEKSSPSGAMDKMIELTRRSREQHVRSTGEAHRAGVKIALGSDFGGFDPRLPAREFATFLEIGMTPMEAIQAGTRVGAELLGWDDRIGTVEPGKLADLVAVAGNPLEDIRELERVIWVMLGGRVVKAPDAAGSELD